MSLGGLAKDPLLHFLLAGAALFAGYSAVSEGEARDASRTISVDRAALLRFIQYRSRAFDAAAADQRLQALTATGLDDVIHQYLREEALYRRALALGLNSDDYVIRRRLVQKMEYIGEGIALDGPAADTQAAELYYREHLERYAEPATVTFAHVFFSHSERPAADAQQLAQRTLQQLNAEQVPLSAATRYGDRFAYQRNYVERPRDEVASHFGAAMAKRLFALPVDAERWQGVLLSERGSHLVLVTAAQPRQVPPFAAVQDRVASDLRSERARAGREAFVAEVLRDYRIEIDPALQTPPQ